MGLKSGLIGNSSKQLLFFRCFMNHIARKYVVVTFSLLSFFTFCEQINNLSVFLSVDSKNNTDTLQQTKLSDPRVLVELTKFAIFFCHIELTHRRTDIDRSAERYKA